MDRNDISTTVFNEDWLAFSPSMVKNVKEWVCKDAHVVLNVFWSMVEPLTHFPTFLSPGLIPCTVKARFGSFFKGLTIFCVWQAPFFTLEVI